MLEKYWDKNTMPNSPCICRCNTCLDSHGEPCEGCKYCDNCKGHMKFDYNARNEEGYKHNEKIVNLFNDFNDIYNFTIQSYKGCVSILIIFAYDYKKYRDKYWKCEYDGYDKLNLPYAYIIKNIYFLGTVGILTFILNFINLCIMNKLKLRPISVKQLYFKICNECEIYDTINICGKYENNDVDIYRPVLQYRTTNNIFLNVKFEEKDKIKKLGGNFDFGTKNGLFSKITKI